MYFGGGGGSKYLMMLKVNRNGLSYCLLMSTNFIIMPTLRTSLYQFKGAGRGVLILVVEMGLNWE